MLFLLFGLYTVIFAHTYGLSDILPSILQKFFRKVVDIFIEAEEYKSLPVRRTDEDPIQKLFTIVRNELSLDQKNGKQEEAKFWKQHPAVIKVMQDGS